MASRLLVECIQRTDRQDAHERIKAIGGGLPGCRWKHTLADAVAWAEDRVFVYYIINQDGREEKVIVARNEHGHKHLKTESDGEQPDNLLNLPECP
jgi:Protein of unknown function (DUF3892)